MTNLTNFRPHKWQVAGHLADPCPCITSRMTQECDSWSSTHMMVCLSAHNRIWNIFPHAVFGSYYSRNFFWRTDACQRWQGQKQRENKTKCRARHVIPGGVQSRRSGGKGTFSPFTKLEVSLHYDLSPSSVVICPAGKVFVFLTQGHQLPLWTKMPAHLCVCSVI